ncbi:MAG: hypothetical protein Kow00109_23010 [Acidobacteriota bacterium]
MILSNVLLGVCVASGFGVAANPASLPTSPEPLVEDQDPVVLEDLGVRIPADLPGPLKELQLLEKHFLLRNLSPQDIVFFSVVYVDEKGTITGGRLRGSYPPYDPPVLGKGETLELHYRGDARVVEKRKPEIDCVVFADGSTYGPDRLRAGREYVHGVRARYLYAQYLLQVLETEGPEALRELLEQAVREPFPGLRDAPKLPYFQAER